MYFGDFGLSPSALRISAAALPRFASRTSVSGQRRSWSWVLVTSAGRRSIRICRRSNDLGERWTGLASCSSSRVDESNTKAPKRTLIVDLRNAYGFLETSAEAPLHNNVSAEEQADGTDGEGTHGTEHLECRARRVAAESLP